MQSPGRFCPNQRVCLLIVMSLGGGIKQNGQNCPHGAKMAAVAYPPERLKNLDSPLLKTKPPRCALYLFFLGILTVSLLF